MSTASTATAAIIAIEEVPATPLLPETTEPFPAGSMEEQQQQPLNPFEDQDTISEVAMASEEKVVLDKHVLRLSTALSLASDSEDEPGIVTVDKLSSRNSAPIFEDLKLNTVSGWRWFTFYSVCADCSLTSLIIIIIIRFSSCAIPLAHRIRALMLSLSCSTRSSRTWTRCTR